jgi:hypothetical protein
MNNLVPVAVWTAATVVLLCAAPSSGAAQGAGAIAPIPARPGDVATIDGMIQAFYDVISGPGGVNSIELFWDGTCWWIAGAIWDGERPDNPIPAALLQDAPRD